MGLCERCGSIQIVRTRAGFTDKVIALVSSQRPFLCRRCGWRARRPWTDAELARVVESRNSGEPGTDPALVVLDQAPKPKSRKRQSSRRKQRSEFDLAA